ncbi:MAG: hypothetical protein HYU80_00460 [Candidatus Blackburnbacteria bacterium]|nr:hypothetical protein [Candidatus Blackburnbacteria bacterium]
MSKRSKISQELGSVIALVEILRNRFQQDLQIIAQEIIQEKDPQTIKEFQQQAEEMYQNYQQSLSLLEEHINQCERMVSVSSTKE